MTSFFNKMALFLKAPLMFFKDLLRDFQEEPASSIYIVFIAALFALGEQLTLRYFFPRHGVSGKISDFIEVLAVILIAAGTIWTAFGVMLSPKTKSQLNKLSLDAYINFKINGPLPGQHPPIDPVNEVVKALNVASNFATSGLFLITLGSILLIIKYLIA